MRSDTEACCAATQQLVRSFAAAHDAAKSTTDAIAAFLSELNCELSDCDASETDEEQALKMVNAHAVESFAAAGGSGSGEAAGVQMAVEIADSTPDAAPQPPAARTSKPRRIQRGGASNSADSSAGVDSSGGSGSDAAASSASLSFGAPGATSTSAGAH